jgi:ABC-type uncharacterized transport system fused permease/ATPase subunit
MLNTTRTFLADLWALTKPYWFSEERWSARGLLAAVVALNLLLVYVSVQLNEWNNDFYNALQNLDKQAFFHQVAKVRGDCHSQHRHRGISALSEPDAGDTLAAAG